MKISLIWGMDRHRLIGKGDGLPWKLPADMQWFRQQTMAKPLLMGRKTYATIGRPLPGRLNMILTRQTDLSIEGCTVVHTLEEAKAAAGDAEELMVMGGAEVYAMLLPMADRLYITHVDGEFEGDTWFPDIDMRAWQCEHTEMHHADEKNAHAYSFEIWQRCNNKP